MGIDQELHNWSQIHVNKSLIYLLEHTCNFEHNLKLIVDVLRVVDTVESKNKTGCFLCKLYLLMINHMFKDRFRYTHYCYGYIYDLSEHLN